MPETLFKLLIMLGLVYVAYRRHLASAAVPPPA